MAVSPDNQKVHLMMKKGFQGPKIVRGLFNETIPYLYILRPFCETRNRKLAQVSSLGDGFKGEAED